MTTYNKTKTEDFNAEQLQVEINGNAGIVPSCLSVSSNDNNLTLEFAAALSAGEETELDTVIANHVPDAELINAAQLPLSNLDGKKLAVHSSPKPLPEGVETYAVWAGAGDKLTGGSPPVALPENETLGAGDLLQFNMEPGTASVVKNISFDPRHGRVWIHEAYLKYENAGLGDTITADVVAPATPVQTAANKDYNIVNDWLIYAGPDAGTHGLAGNPVLVPRTFAKDGDWDFDGVSLTPNFGPGGSPTPGPNGEYKITTVERVVHRYINRLPLYGTTTNYFNLTSDESAELPINLGYQLRVTVVNTSDTSWKLSAIMEVYRERTYMP